MDADATRRLHYVTAIACGVFAALAMHIVLTVLGFGMDKALRTASLGPQVQHNTTKTKKTTAAAGFAGGWATSAYLIAAARERTFVYKLAQRFLIALVFAGATAGGVMSKGGEGGGTPDVVAGLTALALGIVTAYCGARLAYLNAEQV